MFNPRYTQLLQRNATGNNLIPQTGGLGTSGFGVNAVRTLNTTAPITPQVAIRRQGFGGRFEDTPPPFIADKKVDNKIERLKKPKKPNKKKKKKTRNKK
tara:strand:- start:2 stop:298 length:297 start_codon:yes stop_codon:yes gene_type:complete